MTSIAHLADITEGYTGADIASFVSAANMIALREHISKYNQDPTEAEKHANELRVHMRHFKGAMSKIRPLSVQELNWYKTIVEQFDKRRGIRLRGEEIKRGIGGGIT